MPVRVTRYGFFVCGVMSADEYTCVCIYAYIMYIHMYVTHMKRFSKFACGSFSGFLQRVDNLTNKFRSAHFRRTRISFKAQFYKKEAQNSGACCIHKFSLFTDYVTKRTRIRNEYDERREINV